MTDQQEIGHNGASGNAGSALDFVPFRMSEQIDKLAEALAKAQGEMTHPQKNKVARVPMKNGGTYSYNYADLADAIDCIKAPFTKHGLSFVQIPFTPQHHEGGLRGDAIGIVTLLLHSSGQWIEGILHMPVADNKPQTIGSAITYGRRYSLCPMAGIASDDDDDGNAAQGQSAETQRRPGRGGGGGEQRQDPHYEPVGDGVSRPQSLLSEKGAKMLGAFTTLGVTREQIEAHCGGTKLETMSDQELDGLKTLYAELKSGTVKAAQVGKNFKK